MSDPPGSERGDKFDLDSSVFDAEHDAQQPYVERFTPGPWSLGKPDRQGDDVHLCEVMTAYATANEGATVAAYDLICRTWSSSHIASSVRISHEAAIANARLIAAAPDLYAALVQLLDASLAETTLRESAGRRAFARDAARAALRKATSAPRTGAHWSDCAVNNGPALEPGPCDCGADAPTAPLSPTASREDEGLNTDEHR